MFICRSVSFHWFRLISLIILVTFGSNIIGGDAARAWSIAEPQNISLPAAGTLLPTSFAFSLPTLKGIAIDPNDPFKFDFVVDSADKNLNEKANQAQVNLLIKYFLSFLTLPDKDLWVNLSPYEKNRIIISDFETTNAGRDMLVQDYILKQLASSLTYPENETGKIFWKKVYSRALAEYGSTNIPVNTFSKVWVVPDKAVVYEDSGSAFISSSRLKVLTEEDYLSIEKNRSKVNPPAQKPDIDHLSTQVTREIIIPELEREVNQGKYFAPLRQMYNSLILAIWFKKRLKENLISLVYVDRNKISGIALNEKQIKERIYEQYLKAYKKGVYNYVKEEPDLVTGQTVPRKYFSGGFSFVDTAMSVSFLPSSGLLRMRDQLVSLLGKGLFRFTVVLKPLGISKKTLLSLAAGITIMTGAGYQAANAQDNYNATPVTAQNSYISTEPLKVLQKALDKVDGNTGSLLGGHPGSMGYEKVQRIMDAVNDLPANTPIREHAQELKKALLDPQFFQDNLNERNKGVSHGAYLLMHPYKVPASRQMVDSGIEKLKREIANLLSSTHYIYAAPSGTAPWASPTAITNQPITLTIASADSTVTPVPAPAPEQAAPIVTPAPVPVPAAAVAPAPAPISSAAPSLQQAVTNSVTTAVTGALPVLAPAEAAPSAALQPALVSTVGTTPTAIVLPPADTHISAGRTNAQLEVGVAPIVVKDHEIAGNSGIVTWIDPDQKEFGAGKPVGYLLDPLLKSRIEQLDRKLGIEKKILLDLIGQGAASQDIQTAQQKVDEISRELARANQEKEAGVIIAPHALTIEDGTITPNGTLVNKGETLFRYADHQRVRVNFNVPAGVGYFNQVKDLTVNGIPVQSIVSVNWSFDPLHKSAQVSLELIGSSPIPLGTEVLLKAGILGGDTNEHNLTSITGETGTLSTVDKVEQVVIRAPVDGPVRFKVHEGQQVLKGQVIAEVYRLNGQRVEVRAPNSGVVISKAGYEKGAFQTQDELLRIGTGYAFIGDVDDVTSPVLFPKVLNITNGAPVVVQTPWGSLPGQVIAVNQAPYSSKADLGKFQSLEVRAFDQQGILQTNLPVKIILSYNDREKQIILDALAQAEKSKTSAVSAGAPPPPDEERDFMASAAVSTNPPSALTLNTLAGLVDNNRLVTGTQAIGVLQKKQEESLPKATRFSINGGVYMKDGKLYFSGGLMGVLNSAIGGGIQSGNAYAAAVPLVEDIFGNMIDVVSGKVNKEVSLKKKGTEIAVDHMQTEILGQVQKAQNLLIDLGAANQKIDQLKNLLGHLEKARAEIGTLPGESTGADAVVDLDRQLEQNIQDIKARILALKAEQENVTVALNVFAGQSNTNLHQSLKVNLPWGKQFGPIDAQTENLLREALIATNSPNFQMKEAIAAGQAIDMTVKLQGLDKLPALNMAGLYVNDGNLSSTLINVSPNEGLFRTSESVAGANGGLQLNIPLFDSVVKTKAGILALEKEKSRLNLEKTKADLTQELEQAAGDIRNLSAQIQEAEKGYRSARRDLELKIGSHLKLSYQWAAESIELNKRWQELLDLKAQYLKAEAVLRAMGLFGAEVSTQQDLSDVQSIFQTAVSNAVGGPLAGDLRSFEEGADQFPLEHTLSPGSVHYQVGSDISMAWALMHNDTTGSNAGAVRTIKQILAEEPNIFVRHDALRHFLAEFQNDKEFSSALKEVAGLSPYPDVVWELLAFMGAKEDQGIPFLVQMINSAETGNCHLLADLAYQQLGYAITMHPDAFKKLTFSDLGAPDQVNKVFVTLLLRQQDGSNVAENLLKNLRAADLEIISKSLKLYAADPDHKGAVKDKVDQLTALIDHAIGREIGINDIPELFRPDGFSHRPQVWFKSLSWMYRPDTITAVEIGNYKKWNQDFLGRSPLWQTPADYLNTNLLQNIQVGQNELESRSYVIPAGDPFYPSSVTTAESHELDYFLSLGLEGQERFIADPHHIPLVAAKILPLQTPVRGEILDAQKCPVMTDFQGRFLVLNAYVHSEDAELLSLIESYPWIDTLKTDIPNVDDAANNQILRQALGKMYDRTHDDAYLNLLLKTYSPSELHSARDPRGQAWVDAEIKAVATPMAEQVLKEEGDDYHVWYAGYSLNTPSVMQELHDINTLANETDPTKVNGFIENELNHTDDPQVKNLLKELKSVRDGELIPKIKNNDQRFPKIPSLFWKEGVIAGLAVVLGGLSLYLRSLFKSAKKKEQNKDALNNILYIANRVTSLEHMDNLNGSENNDLRMDKIEKREDGLRIITMPEPVFVEPRAQEKLKAWWQVVSHWNRSARLTQDEVLRDFHHVKEFALEALKTIPYHPGLMLSPSGQYQKTLFYYITLANYTLYLLSSELADKNLKPDQKAQLKRDTEDLVQSIEYATNFSLVLHYRSNIQRVLNRRLPEDHHLEKRRWWLLGYSLYGLARAYLYFEYLFSRSLKRSDKALDGLLDQGKELMGLYQNKEEIKIKGKNNLDSVIARGGMEQTARSHDAEIADKIGNFWREIHYPFEAALMLSTTAAALVFLPGIAVFTVGISFYTLLRHSYSVYFYAKPNIDFLNTTWSREINDLARKQRKTLNDIADRAMISRPPEGSAAVSLEKSAGTVKPDEIDQKMIAQLMSVYSEDSAAPELLIPILQKILAGQGEDVKVENADLKRVFYLARLFKEDSLSNRIKKANSKGLLFMSSLRSRKDFKPTTIENLNRDLPVIHINAGVREYYFIVGAVYPTLVRMKDAAMNAGSVNRRGGVDFSKAEGSVLFHQDPSLGSDHPWTNAAGGALKSFKGFEFQVIQYQPILNSAEFFLGSAVHSGDVWFSAKADPVRQKQA